LPLITVEWLFRSSIICMFPELKSLDFAKVTEDEKDSARLHIIISKNNAGKKNKEQQQQQQGQPTKKHSW